MRRQIPSGAERVDSLKILITGGAGFIGSHLVRRLHNDGHIVSVFDSLATGRLTNLSGLSVEFCEGDVRAPDQVRRAVAGMDVVFHTAALPSVARSWDEPVTTLAVNAHGTANVVEAARIAGVKTLIYSSSSSVYGSQMRAIKSEDLLPAPISPYGYSKFLGERIAIAHSERLRVVALRYFNVFGPHQDAGSPYAAVIPKFMRHAVVGTTATLNGPGDHSRDFTYVDNIVDANVRAMHSDATGVAINVACGEGRTLLELVEVISRVTGRLLTVEHGPARKGDIKHSTADLALANRLIGYEPIVNFEEGLRLTYEAYSST